MFLPKGLSLSIGFLYFFLAGFFSGGSGNPFSFPKEKGFPAFPIPPSLLAQPLGQLFDSEARLFGSIFCNAGVCARLHSVADIHTGKQEIK